MEICSQQKGISMIVPICHKLICTLFCWHCHCRERWGRIAAMLSHTWTSFCILQAMCRIPWVPWGFIPAAAVAALKKAADSMNRPPAEGLTISSSHSISLTPRHRVLQWRFLNWTALFVDGKCPCRKFCSSIFLCWPAWGLVFLWWCASIL